MTRLGDEVPPPTALGYSRTVYRVTRFETPLLVFSNSQGVSKSRHAYSTLCLSLESIYLNLLWEVQGL